MTDLLLFAPADDMHAQVVAGHVGDRARVRFIDLGSAVTGALVVEPGAYVSINGEVVAVAGTTVWWRRSGRVPAAETGNAENRLRAEEVRGQVVGGLLSLDVRWVDHPGVVDTAEHTFLQLAEARRAGAVVPSTVATNVAEVALARLAEGRQVAKSISSGVGIAPFADDFDEELAGLLEHAPTVLQDHVAGVADLRVIVVRDDAFIWRRPKAAGEPLDWRRSDPAGREFEQVQDPGITQVAVDITRRLGLTYSAQDWVDTATGPVFIEANPVGQWLFLPGADNIVGPALAAHLVTPEDS